MWPLPFLLEAAAEQGLAAAVQGNAAAVAAVAVAFAAAAAVASCWRATTDEGLATAATLRLT